MSDLKQDETEIGVTSFKAKCLAIIDDVAKGKTGRVILTKHDKPVAAIVPLCDEPIELWGAMRGSVTVPAGSDVSAPTGEEWAADA